MIKEPSANPRHSDARQAASLLFAADFTARFSSNQLTPLGEQATFEPFSPDFFSRNQSPITYDANATCPRFTNDLLAPALSVEDISLIQRWVGVAFYGINLPQR